MEVKKKHRGPFDINDTEKSKRRTGKTTPLPRGASLWASLLITIIMAVIALCYYDTSEGRIYPIERYPAKGATTPDSSTKTPQKSRKNPPNAHKPLRLMTLNAWNYFVNEDPRRSNNQIHPKSIPSREAMADYISQVNPEVLGLCEMGGEKAIQDLQLRLKNKGVDLPYYVMVMREGEDRGLALLSHYPVIRNDSIENLRLKGWGQTNLMRRGILDVTIETPDKRTFRFIGIHLKSRLTQDNTDESVRQRESYALKEHLEEAMKENPQMPIILYGDFNDGQDNASLHIIQGNLRTKTAMYKLIPSDRIGQTWTIYYPKGGTYNTFDHILINNVMKERLGKTPSMGIEPYEPENSKTHKVSDHRGLWVDLK